MSFNQSNGGAAIVAAADTQIGKPYSEQSPPGSDDDGHLWSPGDPDPTYFDCSGLVHYATAIAGCPVSEGNANDQWIQSLGGKVPNSAPLVPGDVCAFMGVNNIPGYAGHIGIVQTYDNVANSGTLVNAYDTAEGVTTTPFTRTQVTNGNNGLGWVGAFRPSNSLPPAPTPPPVPTEDTLLLIVINPNNKGQAVLNLADGTYYGFPNDDMRDFYADNGVKPATRQPTKAEWAHFTQKGTI